MPCSDLFHLAGLTKEPGYQRDEYFETNYLGTINVCNFADCSNIRNIVYCTTMMVYAAGEKRMSEASLPAPETFYGMSKLLGELALREWATTSEREDQNPSCKGR